ncbi:hypothetical protein KA107_01730 [Candidatus Pacearchaeota archaeon]|nr:hypothetical protein [Candidatus Pacearchaeota archaeon]
MIKLMERLTTCKMTEYPYYWIGPQESGCISRYCDARDGFRLNKAGPNVGEFVFKSTEDGSLAYVVSFSNCETGRLRVRPVELHIEYNAVLREHRKKFGRNEVDPHESRISLVAVRK